MSKPLGLYLGLTEGGGIVARVRKTNRATDMIWDAVEEAINSGMTPKEFKYEVAEAWEQRLKDDAKDAVKELQR